MTFSKRNIFRASMIKAVGKKYQADQIKIKKYN